MLHEFRSLAASDFSAITRFATRRWRHRPAPCCRWLDGPSRLHPLNNHSLANQTVFLNFRGLGSHVPYLCLRQHIYWRDSLALRVVLWTGLIIFEFESRAIDRIVRELEGLQDLHTLHLAEGIQLISLNDVSICLREYSPTHNWVYASSYLTHHAAELPRVKYQAQNPSTLISPINPRIYFCIKINIITNISMASSDSGRPPYPPFDFESATKKVKAAQDAWNTWYFSLCS